MKKASYKKHMKPLSYQQPVSPKEIPGFSSYHLSLLFPFSQLHCTTEEDVQGNAGITFQLMHTTWHSSEHRSSVYYFQSKALVHTPSK